MAKSSGVMEAKLLLDSKEFEQKLQDAKKKTNKFGKEVKDSTDKAGGGFQRLVGDIKNFAAAMGAIEAVKWTFNAWVTSSQENTDKWGRLIAGLNVELEHLKATFLGVDTRMFVDGIDKAIERAEKLYDTIDKFNNVQISASFATKLDETRYQAAIARAKDTSLSQEERRAALEEARALNEQMAETARYYQTNAFDVVRQTLAAEAGLEDFLITPDMVERVLRIDSRATSDKLRSKAKEDWDVLGDMRRYLLNTWPEKQLRIRDQEARWVYGYKDYKDMAVALGPERARELTKEAVTSIWRAELAELNSMETSFAESLTTYVALFKFGDEKLRELSDTYTSYTNAMNQSIAHSKELLEVERAFATEQQAAADKTEKAAEAAREYADVLATMPWSTREAINAANGAFQNSFTGATGKLQGMSLYDGGGTGARSGFEVPALPEYGGEYAWWKFNANPIKSSGALEAMGVQTFDWEAMQQMSRDEELMQWAAKNREEFDKWGASIDLLGGAFKSLGDSIGGTTGQLLSFIGGLVDAAQQMLPFIAQIMAETAAREANASAAATEAAAKSMSAYAGIPFAGIGLGLAAVAAVVGAIQSVPKFAEGGIVTSATLGVFGEAGPEAVMPLDRLEEFVTGRDVRVTGNIKASGKELVVVLDNYNRVRNG